MGLEDDFLKNDLDDEKTIEYIKNYLPQELKEKFNGIKMKLEAIKKASPEHSFRDFENWVSRKCKSL